MLPNQKIRCIIGIEKGKTSNGYATSSTIFSIAACARGGYCAFMGNIIIRMITTKSAISSFFAICTILTFHKHAPFHRLGISACEYKSSGITAGVNTAKKSYLWHRITPTKIIIQHFPQIFKCVSVIANMLCAAGLLSATKKTQAYNSVSLPVSAFIFVSTAFLMYPLRHLCPRCAATSCISVFLPFSSGRTSMHKDGVVFRDTIGREQNLTIVNGSRNG